MCAFLHTHICIYMYIHVHLYVYTHTCRHKWGGMKLSQQESNSPPSPSSTTPLEPSHSGSSVWELFCAQRGSWALPLQQLGSEKLLGFAATAGLREAPGFHSGHGLVCWQLPPFTISIASLRATLRSTAARLGPVPVLYHSMTQAFWVLPRLHCYHGSSVVPPL